MSNISSSANLYYIIFLILPGFVAYKTYTLKVPVDDPNPTRMFLDSLSFSVVYYLILVVPLGLFYFYKGVLSLVSSEPIIITVYLLFVLLVWPAAYGFLRAKRTLQLNRAAEYPTGWDFIWTNKKDKYLLLTLEDGTLIGGYWGDNSYASGYPKKQDLYIEQMLPVSSDGDFLTVEPSHIGRGCYVKGDLIKYIETIPFFSSGDDSEEGENINEQNSNNGQ